MYVNDLLIISCDKEAITETKKNLYAAFKAKHLGMLRNLLEPMSISEPNQVRTDHAMIPGCVIFMSDVQGDVSIGPYSNLLGCETFRRSNNHPNE